MATIGPPQLVSNLKLYKMRKQCFQSAAWAALVLSCFLSCHKVFSLLEESRNPLLRDCQVAEYHIPIYDSYYPPRIPFLFKKTFDPSTKILKEIECYFQDDVPPQEIIQPIFHHVLKLAQKDRMIFLINNDSNIKGNTPDTVAKITLNNEGRAESCEANGELNPDSYNHAAQTEYFIYKNDRLQVIKSYYITNNGILGPAVDSVHYDKFGNVLAFGSNSYQYDYTRKAREQFYCDDFMGGDEPYYLLQYLGFFPEVTSPVNLRTHVETIVFHGDLSNHRFDGEGRLIGYDFYVPISIAWNCK
jgi:hypothetical protein